VGIGYVGANPLALAVTALIAAFYLMGALELRRFHQATASLAQALAALSDPLPNLGAWLAELPASLQNPVRLRVEGERVGLPGPVMTPYLVGLLVLLGMLGTFLGMVVTLNGAVQTLESSADLSTMRAALTAPVKGLGLAFGTSVAGVAASAVLGLMSALCRRERLQAAQHLDTRIATVLRVYSQAHQREETLKSLQSQAQAMPLVVDQLQAMLAQTALQHQQLGERLLASQDSFHQGAKAVYADLATAVDQSLQRSLTESARVAGATIQPVVEATMAGIARETGSLHARVADTVQRQLEGLSRETAGLHEKMADTVQRQLDGVAIQFGNTVNTVSAHWVDALAQHQRGSAMQTADMQTTLAGLAQTFEQRSAALLAGVDQAHASLQAQLSAGDAQRLAAWTQSMGAMATTLQQEWRLAGAQALGQQEQICQTLDRTARDITAQAEAHARSTITEIGQLMQAASEAPRVAAEVIGQLRQQLSSSIANDTAMLEERSRIMATLSTLLDAVQHASTEQRGAIDTLLSATATVLEQAGSRFTAQVEAESGKLGAVAAQITGSAVEVSSLGEAFGHAVQLFSESNDKLMGHLQRIEGALDKSIARSDDQLAYYVAQAREVIDLSILSQKQIVEDLQQLASRQHALADEVA
jgi:hypothetical protein